MEESVPILLIVCVVCIDVIEIRVNDRSERLKNPDIAESRRSGQWLLSRYASPFAKGPENSSSARHSEDGECGNSTSFLSEIYFIFFFTGTFYIILHALII